MPIAHIGKSHHLKIKISILKEAEKITLKTFQTNERTFGIIE